MTTYTIVSAAQWPSALERERMLHWIPDFQNRTSPPSLTGTKQYSSSNGGGLWSAIFANVQLRYPHILEWLAMESILRGGATPVDVPLLLCKYQPWPADRSSIVIKAEDGGWAARAMSGHVRLDNAGTLLRGMSFSDYDATTYGHRLHRIEKVTLVAGAVYNIEFWPPARFAVADEHRLEFDNPRCVMRLTSSDAMDIQLDQRKRAQPNASFTEAE